MSRDIRDEMTKGKREKSDREWGGGGAIQCHCRMEDEEEAAERISEEEGAIA